MSRTTRPTTPLKSAADLVDFRGFKDKRYLTLAVGTFLASLGLYIPYYYIGRHLSSVHGDKMTGADDCHSTICGIHIPPDRYRGLFTSFDQCLQLLRSDTVSSPILQAQCRLADCVAQRRTCRRCTWPAECAISHDHPLRHSMLYDVASRSERECCHRLYMSLRLLLGNLHFGDTGGHRPTHAGRKTGRSTGCVF